MNRTRKTAAPGGRRPLNTSQCLASDFRRQNSIADAITQRREQLVNELFLNGDRMVELDRQEPGHIAGLLETHPVLAQRWHELARYRSQGAWAALDAPDAVIMKMDAPVASDCSLASADR